LHQTLDSYNRLKSLFCCPEIDVQAFTNFLLTQAAVSHFSDLFSVINELWPGSKPDTPLRDHYSRMGNLAELKGVECIKPGYGLAEYLVVTGNKVHFLLHDNCQLNCPYHSYAKGRNSGNVINHPKMTSDFDEPCFFPDGDDCHCAHSEAYASKCEPVNAGNRERCGPHSGDDGSPFCEIYPFERFLCCKACVFEPVCSNSEAFSLPCP